MFVGVGHDTHDTHEMQVPTDGYDAGTDGASTDRRTLKPKRNNPSVIVVANCSDMDGHVVSVFAVQASVTAVMLAFCVTMLVKGSDPGIYLPVMTGITGFWFPSPLQANNPSSKASVDVIKPRLHEHEPDSAV